MKKNMFRFIFVFIFSICVYTLNICDIFAGEYIFSNTSVTNTFSQRICFYEKKFENVSLSGSRDIEDAFANGKFDTKTYYAIKFEYDDKKGKYKLYNSNFNTKDEISEYFVRLWDDDTTVDTGFYSTNVFNEYYSECPSALYYTGSSWIFDAEEIKDEEIYITKGFKLVNSKSCTYGLEELEGESNNKIVYHVLDNQKITFESNSERTFDSKLGFGDFLGENAGLTCPKDIDSKLDGDKIVISMPKDGTSGNTNIDNAVSNTDDDSSFNSSSVVVGCETGEGTEIAKFEIPKYNMPSSDISSVKIESVSYLRHACNITITGGNKYAHKIGGPWCKSDNYYLTKTQLPSGAVRATLYSCGSNVEETETETESFNNICLFDTQDNNVKVEIVVSPTDKKILSANIIGGNCGTAKFINVTYDEIYDEIHDGVYDEKDCKKDITLAVDTDKCRVISNRYIYTTGKRICGIFKENGKLIGVVKNLYAILRISIPVLILCLTIVEFLKVLFSGEGKTMKEAFKATVSRFILLAVVVLLPFIISFITRLAGIYDTCYKFFI